MAHDRAGWLDENRDAMDSITLFIQRHGLLANRLRFHFEAGERANPNPSSATVKQPPYDLVP